LLCNPLKLTNIKGFETTGNNEEQELWIKNGRDSVTININAPLHFRKKGKTYLIFFASPNGNSIEWTKGKKMQPGDDWHFDIQQRKYSTYCADRVYETYIEE
jgi:hypothetical protein